MTVPFTDEASQRLVHAVIERSREIVEGVEGLSDAELRQPSGLPEWTRVTIACHLRFGAEALSRMTRATLLGEPVAYYPEGRGAQRPQTLLPRPHESPHEVVASLARLSEQLHQEWSALGPGDWSADVVEPEDNPDLGPVSLERLLLLRLTEVEVHGTDLGVDLADWTEIFVDTVLPMRLQWLNVRRANHRAFDTELRGSWLLVATDGPTYRVSVDGTLVESSPARKDTQARAVIAATSRDLLALLLGRALRSPPVVTGDIEFGQSFSSAFPGP
jgi:maleylpyruvate isomerase